MDLPTYLALPADQRAAALDALPLVALATLAHALAHHARHTPAHA
jgi:hypothetical protein